MSGARQLVPSQIVNQHEYDIGPPRGGRKRKREHTASRDHGIPLHDRLGASVCMTPKIIAALFLLPALSLALDRGEEIRLWPNGAPGSEGETAPEVFQASD